MKPKCTKMFHTKKNCKSRKLFLDDIFAAFKERDSERKCSSQILYFPHEMIIKESEGTWAVQYYFTLKNGKSRKLLLYLQILP